MIYNNSKLFVQSMLLIIFINTTVTIVNVFGFMLLIVIYLELLQKKIDILRIVIIIGIEYVIIFS